MDGPTFLACSSVQDWFQHINHLLISQARATERIGGAQGKYKEWGPEIWMVEGGLGARPQETLRFYML